MALYNYYYKIGYVIKLFNFYFKSLEIHSALGVRQWSTWELWVLISLNKVRRNPLLQE